MSSRIPVEQSQTRKFYYFFQDDKNLYVVSELCKRKLIVELSKCRYYISAIVQVMKFLHDKHIIHRVPRLQGILMKELINVVIDEKHWSFRSQLDENDRRRQDSPFVLTYVEAKVLREIVHSFLVEIRSADGVKNKLLVGYTPLHRSSFEGPSKQIKEYKDLSMELRSKSFDSVKVAINRMESERGPACESVLEVKFLPMFFLDLDPPFLPRTLHRIPTVYEANLMLNPRYYRWSTVGNDLRYVEIMPYLDKLNLNVRELYGQIFDLIDAKPKIIPGHVEAGLTDLVENPIYWVTDFINYRHKFGFAYKLCDERVGITFGDGSTFLMLPDSNNVNYVDDNGHTIFMTTREYSEALQRKMTLLKYFRNKLLARYRLSGRTDVLYMPEEDELFDAPHVCARYFTRRAFIMQLTDDSFQFNFFDNVKVLLSPRNNAIACIDKDKNLRIHKYESIMQGGWSYALHEQISYALNNIGKIIDSEYF